MGWSDKRHGPSRFRSQTFLFRHGARRTILTVALWFLAFALASCSAADALFRDVQDRVESAKERDDTESDDSGGSTDDTNGTTDESPPGDVTDLNTTPADGSIKLEWNDPATQDLASIRISWEPEDGPNQPLIAAAGEESARIDGLSNGTSYNLTVTALDQHGNDSSGKSVQETPQDLTPPGEVTALITSAVHQKLRVGWNDPSDEDLDAVQLQWTPGDGPSQPVTVSAGSEYALIDGLNNNTQYTITAQTVDDAGNTSPGAQISGEPVSPQEISNISVLDNPESIDVDEERRLVYVANREAGSVSVIDGSTLSVDGLIDVGSDPNAVSVNGPANTIYVSRRSSNAVEVLSGADMSQDKTISVGDAPVALDTNANTNYTYVANADGDNVSVIDGATNSVTETVAVGTLPIGVAVNPKTNKIYVGNLNSDSVSVIDGSTHTVSTVIALSESPTGLAVNPETNRLYVAHEVPSNVSIVDGSTASVIEVISVSSPNAIAVNRSMNRIYAVDAFSGDLKVIDGGSASLVYTLALGDNPFTVATNPLTNRLYVPDTDSNAVSIIGYQ
jgi:YVTN family beta-propeller protein